MFAHSTLCFLLNRHSFHCERRSHEVMAALAPRGASALGRHQVSCGNIKTWTHKYTNTSEDNVLRIFGICRLEIFTHIFNKQNLRNVEKNFFIAAVLFCESLLLWNSSSFHQIVPSPFLFYFLTVETLWFPLWRHSQMFFSLPMSAPLWIFNLEPKFLLWDPTSVATVGNAWPCTNQPTLRLIAKIAVFTFVLQFPFPCVFFINFFSFSLQLRIFLQRP